MLVWPPNAVQCLAFGLAMTVIGSVKDPERRVAADLGSHFSQDHECAFSRGPLFSAAAPPQLLTVPHDDLSSTPASDSRISNWCICGIADTHKKGVIFTDRIDTDLSIDNALSDLSD